MTSEIDVKAPKVMPSDNRDTEKTSEDEENVFMPDLPQESSSTTPEAQSVPSSPQYPQRVRRPPVRYGQ